MSDGEGRWPGEREAIDAALLALCDRHASRSGPVVADAIRYALLGGGKRIRGVLVLMAYRACRGRGDAAPLAAAVEVVHAYSLVHDDLPCMDDDDVRRGRPTVHRAFDVRTATVGGVAMVPLAVRAAYDAASGLGLSAAARGAIVRELMRASGATGMVGGQLLDLTAEGVSLSLGQMERVHHGKTGALIAASARLGGIAAGADTRALAALSSFGASLGLAFQIVDDVLDVTATSDQLGKTAGKDAAVRKSTYPALLGVEGAVARATELVDGSFAELAAAGLLTADLRDIGGLVVARRH